MIQRRRLGEESLSAHLPFQTGPQGAKDVLHLNHREHPDRQHQHLGQQDRAPACFTGRLQRSALYWQRGPGEWPLDWSPSGPQAINCIYTIWRPDGAHSIPSGECLLSLRFRLILSRERGAYPVLKNPCWLLCTYPRSKSNPSNGFTLIHWTTGDGNRPRYAAMLQQRQGRRKL